MNDLKKELRIKAEKELDSKMGEIEAMSPTDLRFLIHELNVHHIELEMQNIELKEARLQLELSLEKYSDLYDLAPIAYFTLDKNGTIEEINITGSNMLLADKRHLVNKRFQNFVSPDDKERFHIFLSRVFSSRSRQSCEIAVVDKRNKKTDVQMIGIPVNDQVKNEFVCRTAMIDVTDLKMARQIIKTNIEEKEKLNIILKTQEQERKRIAESLHNGVGQTLYAAKLKLDQFLKGSSKDNNILELKNLLMDAINEVKVISFELIPAILEDFGLETVLKEMCRKFSTENGLKFSCTLYGYERRWDFDFEIAIYRIIQELVNNIIKHAEATEGKIYLTITDKIVIRVEDNGKGFSGEEAIKKTEGTGLKNIKNRVKLLNGNLYFTLGAPKGTTVVVNLPL